MAYEAFLILLRFKLHCMHMALIFDGCEDTGHEILVFLFEYCWPIMRKNCSKDWKKNLCKYEEEGRDGTQVLRSLDQFIPRVKGRVVQKPSFLSN